MTAYGVIKPFLRSRHDNDRETVAVDKCTHVLLATPLVNSHRNYHKMGLHPCTTYFGVLRCPPLFSIIDKLHEYNTKTPRT